MKYDDWAPYVITAFIALGLLTLVVGGLHSLQRSVSSIEEIDDSQFPLLEDLAILIRLQQTSEDHFKLAVFAGLVGSIDDYELSILTLEDRIRSFNNEASKHDFFKKPLDRSKLSQIEGDILNGLRKDRRGSKLRQRLDRLPPELKIANENFKTSIYQVTHSLTESRRAFMQNRKDEFQTAFNLGIVICTLLVACTVLGFLTFRRLAIKRKNLESLAINTSRLASLGEMAGGVAHEINNPLAIVSGFLDLAQSNLESGEYQNIEKAIYRISKAQASLVRITDIVRALRVFSRDGSDDLQEDVPIEELVADSISLCSERMSNMHIQFEMDIEENLVTYGNKTELSQVLINLISNSMYAIKGQDYPWIRIGAKKKGEEELELSVIDSGKGIPSEIVDQLTKPFFTTKPVGEGTGLGLSISFGIIANHKGKLEYDKASKHTKFDITLPYNGSNEYIGPSVEGISA